MNATAASRQKRSRGAKCESAIAWDEKEQPTSAVPTVLRALRSLRDEGLLEFRRGRGVHVSGTPERGAVIAKARELFALAQDEGLARDELMRIIRQLP